MTAVCSAGFRGLPCPRLPLRPLPLAGEPDIPLYTGDAAQLQADAWDLIRDRGAEKLFPLSHPSKMDCPAWGISAIQCDVGKRLRKLLGSTCHGCYAMKGTFMAKNVVKKMEQAFDGLHHPLWTVAGTVQVRTYAKDRFRWFHSGDLQGVNHLRNIIRVCLETPEVMHWLPTREMETVFACRDEIPENLTVRLSAAMVDGPPPKNWTFTSTVTTDPEKATCPTSLKGGNCGTHGCTACWDEEGDRAYLRH